MPPIRKTKIREEITAKIQSRLQGATKKYADKILMPQRYLAKSPSINRTAVTIEYSSLAEALKAVETNTDSIAELLELITSASEPTEISMTYLRWLSENPSEEGHEADAQLLQDALSCMGYEVAEINKAPSAQELTMSAAA